MFRQVTRSAALVILLAMTAACASTGGPPPPPPQTVRSGADTAPADLQLVCANAVAIELNTNLDKTLPISSVKAQGESYQVTVAADQRQANCFVTADGVVQSIVPL